ncbi:hypothetical protein BSZ39_01070 [Bowdeniella nasicola]|uniref:Uncharacterized protein n=1 Tax=Bowdeniella nasicola TaxID=208480 RepID=A0A1Q5Q5D7_9ACTO|nr:molecular chaperone TorD family protein [Bowdeniella nasicola]OKL55001.1 hypothetical protein BSZ39_01070 [Bowdeniella nasicola]
MPGALVPRRSAPISETATTGDAARDWSAVDPADIADRAIAWTVISAAFADSLKVQTLAALRDAHQLAEWPLQGADFAAACQEFGMSAALSETAEAEAALRLAHQRMMTWPGRVDPSPWESVHRSRDGLVFDEQTRQVRAAYREVWAAVQAAHEGAGGSRRD